jgi:hypothetical protein
MYKYSLYEILLNKLRHVSGCVFHMSAGMNVIARDDVPLNVPRQVANLISLLQTRSLQDILQQKLYTYSTRTQRAITAPLRLESHRALLSRT